MGQHRTQHRMQRMPASKERRGTLDSTRIPAAKAAGDLVSYDVYYVSVPHIHGGQQYVINFYDHYSALNMPYLLARKSD
eukprot:1454123-Pleurochrysis_carterae.AAC.1